MEGNGWMDSSWMHGAPVGSIPRDYRLLPAGNHLFHPLARGLLQCPAGEEADRQGNQQARPDGSSSVLTPSRQASQSSS
jgi:hypothetical protein